MRLFLMVAALLLITSNVMRAAEVDVDVDAEVDVDIDIFDPDESRIRFEAEEAAEEFAKEFQSGNHEHATALLGNARRGRVTLAELGLTDEQQQAVYREAQQQTVPHLKKKLRTLRKSKPDQWDVYWIRDNLELCRLTPADIGTTEEELAALKYQAIVNRARNQLQNYRNSHDEFHLSDFCSTVKLYSLVAKDLGLTAEQLKSLLHQDAVNDAKRILAGLPGRSLSTPTYEEDILVDLSNWFYFPTLQQLIADGVTLQEIKLSEQEWQELCHGYDIDQATTLLDEARMSADQQKLAGVKEYLVKGVTLEELNVSPRAWESLPHRFDVTNAQDALRYCKVYDSATSLAKLEELLTRGVTLEEVELTEKKLEALRQYIKAVNE